MNRSSILRLGVAFGLVLVLGLVLFGAMALSGRPAAAESVQRWFLTMIASGSTSYSSQQNLGASFVGNYGTVQVQVTSDVSETATVVTVVPQFSNDATDCTLASNWFTATKPVFYTAQTTSNEIVSSQVNTQTTTVVTDTSTITQEVGYIITSTTSTSTAAPTLSHVDWSFTITGDKAGAMELPVQGACMRIRISASGSDTFTPTIMARMMNKTE